MKDCVCQMNSLPYVIDLFIESEIALSSCSENLTGSVPEPLVAHGMGLVSALEFREPCCEVKFRSVGSPRRGLQRWKSLVDPAAFRQAQMKSATTDSDPPPWVLWHNGSHVGGGGSGSRMKEDQQNKWEKVGVPQSRERGVAPGEKGGKNGWGSRHVASWICGFANAALWSL